MAGKALSHGGHGGHDGDGGDVAYRASSAGTCAARAAIEDTHNGKEALQTRACTGKRVVSETASGGCGDNGDDCMVMDATILTMMMRRMRSMMVMMLLMKILW